MRRSDLRFARFRLSKVFIFIYFCLFTIVFIVEIGAQPQLTPSFPFPAVVENCHVIVGHAFPPGKSEILDRALASSETLLLYPGKDSVPIDKFYVDAKAWTKQDAPAENSTEIDNCGVAEPAAPADGGDAKTGTPVRDLILVDGTWRCAKKIMRYNKRLTSVHRVHCKVTREGQFKFRQEPRNGYVSTLEALCFALSQLDETRFDEPCKAMLKGFDEMVSIQCSYISNHGTPRKEGQRKPIPVPPRRPTGEDTKGIDIKDGANSASSTTSVPAAELRGARRYVRTWGGGFEEEIHRFVREAQLDDAEMKRLQAKSDNIRFEWSLCETVNRIDATQTYRELFRMEKINYRDAIRAAKLANGHQSRGNRVTVISSKRLQDSAGPEMLLPPGVKSREPITWKGRGLREPQHRE